MHVVSLGWLSITAERVPHRGGRTCVTQVTRRISPTQSSLGWHSHCLGTNGRSLPPPFAIVSWLLLDSPKVLHFKCLPPLLCVRIRYPAFTALGQHASATLSNTVQMLVKSQNCFNLAMLWINGVIDLDDKTGAWLEDNAWYLWVVSDALARQSCFPFIWMLPFTSRQLLTMTLLKSMPYAQAVFTSLKNIMVLVPGIFSVPPIRLVASAKQMLLRTMPFILTMLEKYSRISWMFEEKIEGCWWHGRVVKGVGHLDHVWSCGVREVVSSIPDRSNIVGWVFHPDQVTGKVFSSEHAFPSKFWIYLEQCPRVEAVTTGHCAFPLWGSQPRKICHSGHYYYYYIY